MRHFLFCHGFGFDKTFWRNLSPYFKDEKVSLLDLGYFGKKQHIDIVENEEIIAIGHSLGFIKLLSLYPKINYLVGLNCFGNFLGFNKILHNKRCKELTLLKNGFIKSPEITLKKFYKNCGAFELIKEIDFTKMQLNYFMQDLALLENNFKMRADKMLIICAQNDIIVPPILIKDNFSNILNSKIVIYPTGEHMLGFKKAKRIFEDIINFINNNNAVKIQNRFNKASKTYDSVSSVQKKTAIFLCDKIAQNTNKAPNSILDCGAGTGGLTEILLKYFPTSCYCLNDISQNMIEQCKHKFSSYKNINFIQGNMINLDNSTYDYVVSNLALQWLPDLQKTLQFLSKKSKHIFAFSTLLPGTFKQWFDLVQKYQYIEPLNYIEEEHIIQYCKKEDGNFFHWHLDIDLTFSNIHEFLLYLRALGASAANHAMNPANLRKMLKNEKQQITVTYKIFFGVLVKKPI